MRGKRKNQTKPTVEVLTFNYEELNDSKIGKVVRGIEDLPVKIRIQVKQNNKEYYFHGWDYYTVIEIYEVEGDYVVVFKNRRFCSEEELIYHVIRKSWGWVAGKIVLCGEDEIKVMGKDEVEKLIEEYKQKENYRVKYEYEE
jgi:hypothetical protein